MLLRSRRFVFICSLVLAIGLCPARADDVEAVKEKLYQAKKEYDGELRKFRKAVTDFLDKREEAARSTGDRKLVAQVKAEQKAFEKSGELPAKLPTAFQDEIKLARTKLGRAYTAAIKDYLQLKDDKAAEDTEKEQQKVLAEAALLFGKRTYLTTLKHYDVKVQSDWFTNNGTVAGSDGKIKLLLNGGHASHSIYTVPVSMEYSQVKYKLGGKTVALRATIGVPKFEDTTSDPASALTFEVIGDGKSLWKSEPVTKVDEFQTCVVYVEKVQVLTLKVHCPKSFDWARACWIEPILVQ